MIRDDDAVHAVLDRFAPVLGVLNAFEQNREAGEFPQKRQVVPCRRRPRIGGDELLHRRARFGGDQVLPEVTGE